MRRRVLGDIDLTETLPSAVEGFCAQSLADPRRGQSGSELGQSGSCVVVVSLVPFLLGGCKLGEMCLVLHIT